MLSMYSMGVVGATASANDLMGFVGVASPMTGFDKDEMVLCKRSSGEWCHARVFAYEKLIDGGIVTLQVDKDRRKVPALSRPRSSHTRQTASHPTSCSFSRTAPLTARRPRPRSSRSSI